MRRRFLRGLAAGPAVEAVRSAGTHLSDERAVTAHLAGQLVAWFASTPISPNSKGPFVANRLAAETSPYLRQRADNPVDWWPWGDEAFAEAVARDVPVFLSVGYSSCHWCHVIAHGVAKMRRLERIFGT